MRNLLNFGGYIEGWATYVEMYAYGLSDTDPNLAELYRLNRSLTLGLSSLMDIAVHYHGFTEGDVAEALSKFGFEEASAQALYEALLEAPANYLRTMWAILPSKISGTPIKRKGQRLLSESLPSEGP